MDTRTRWWSPPSAICLVALLVTAASHLSSTGWTGNLEKVPYLALVGTLLGMALGASRFSRRTAHGMALAYTLFFIAWQLGTVVEGSPPWIERLSTLYARLYWALQQFFSNQPVTDPILFLASMLLLFWLLGISAGYLQLRYGRPWIPLLIAGLSIVVVDIYHPGLGRTSSALAIFVVLSLLLATQLHYLKNSTQWEQEASAVEIEVEFSLGKWALIASIVLVLLAWNSARLTQALEVPSSNPTWISTTWNNLRSHFENLFSSLRGPAVVTVEHYGSSLNLGTGTPQSEDIVFTVQADAPRPEGAVYYWRAYTYDRYERGVWKNTLETKTSFPPDTPLVDATLYLDRQHVLFTFQAQRHLDTLYAPATPFLVNRTVVGLVERGENTTSAPLEVVALEASTLVRPGEHYRVESLIASPTEADLRAAGRDYPAWVRERYLDIPIPLSISKLAGTIAGDLDNPYDQAVAITRYLRENYIYSTSIPDPPANRDPIIWFLFDLKRGFCNYYASAEVLLLRSLGIPARLAVGYAQGISDSSGTQFTVRQKDSHAWPEVYFPGIGWVEFEPTSSQPFIYRPQGANAEESSGTIANPLEGNTRERAERFNRLEGAEIDGGATPSAAEIPQSTRPPVWLFMVILLALSAMAFVLYRARRRAITPSKAPLPERIEQRLYGWGWHVPQWLRVWANYTRLTSLERLFLQLELIARILGLPMPAGGTPHEQIALLSAQFPVLQEPALALLQEYEREIYSPHPADLQRAREAVRAMWHIALRYRLMRKPRLPQATSSRS